MSADPLVDDGFVPDEETVEDGAPDEADEGAPALTPAPADDGFVEDGFIPDPEPAPAAPALSTQGFTPGVPLTADFEGPTGVTRWDAASPAGQAPMQNFVAPSPEMVAEQKAAERARIKLAFETVNDTNPDEEAKVLGLARAFGLKRDIIRTNLPAFEKTARAVAFDPDEWAKQNPQLKRTLLENPELAPSIVRNVEVSGLTRALAQVGDLFREDFARQKAADRLQAQAMANGGGGAFTEAASAIDQTALDLIMTGGRGSLAKWIIGGGLEATTRLNTASKQVTEVDDAKAKATRESPLSSLLIPYERLQENLRQLDLSRLSYQQMITELNGNDSTELQGQIHDLQLQSVPRAYGETGLTQVLSEVAGNSGSTIDTAIRAGAYASGAAIASGLISYAITRKAKLGVSVAEEVGQAAAGATAKAAASKGASVGARAGAAFGAIDSTFVLEAGSTYAESANWRTDAGKQLSTDERAGASLVVGLINTGLELLEFNAIVEGFGPGVAEAVKGGNSAKIIELMKTDPKFRVMVARAGKALAKTIATEAGEEGAQEYVGQAAEYLETATAGQYAKALQTGELRSTPVVSDPNKIPEAMAAASKGALGFGLAGPAIQITSSFRHVDQGAKSANQTKLIQALSEQKAVQASPAEFADMVAKTTGESGAPVTALHVDGAALQRYFQERHAEDADAQLTDLLGPEAPARLAEAVATGGKLEIPMADVLGKWGQSDAAKALLEDTTTQAALLTPREHAAKGMAEQIEKEAQAFAADQVAKAVDDSKVTAELEKVGEELKATGKYSAKEVSSIVTLWKHFWDTRAKEAGVTVGDLFQNLRVTFGLGDEKPATTDARLQQPNKSTPAASRVLTEHFNAQDQKTAEGVDAQQRDFYIDTTTGALNKRAFERIDPAGRQVAVISVEGVKYTNDAVGHEGGNSVYRAAAQALAPHAPELAKVGGDFAVYVKDQGELNSILEKANANAVLGGHQLEGAVGPNLRAASEANNDAKKAAEKARLRAERGQRPFKATSPTPVALAAEKLAGTPVSDALKAKHAALSPEQRFNETFIEASTGLLTKDGWDRLPRKKFVASIDLNGLKDFNTMLTEKVGDLLIERFGNALRELGGHEFDATHMSGDEYMAQHDDEAALKAWVKEAQAEAAKAAINLVISEKRRVALDLPTRRVQISGLHFGAGVGESVDHAEHALNTDKARLAAEGLRGNGAARKRVVGRPAEDAGRGRRSGSGIGDVGRRSALREVGRQQFIAQEVDPKKLNQADGSAPKGYTEVPDSKEQRKVFGVFLNKTADISTVVHESAHVFLEMMRELAARPDASARTKQIWADTLKALGATEGLTREHHETFARGFERWLLEGHAPAKALEGAFTRFKLWLMSIYKSAASLKVDLSPELKSVFERLLATDEEIARHQGKEGPAVFANAEEAGMTPEQWADYQAQQVEDTQFATRRAELFALKDRLRETEAWWKEEHAKQVDLAEQAFEELPAQKALQMAAGRINGVKFGEPMVLDRAKVEAVVGKALRGKLETAVDGANPDQLAVITGYPTGAVMLSAMAGLPSKEQWVAAEADAKMSELHPSVLDDRSKLRELVADGLHSVTEKRILTEWAALAKKDPTGQRPTPVEVMKRASVLIVAARSLRSLNANAVLTQERAAARASAIAAVKGNWREAIDQKRKQLLNAFVYREMLKAVDERERFTDALTAAAKDKARARVGKGSAVIRDAIDFVTETLGIKQPGQEPMNRDALALAVAEVEEKGETLGGWVEPVTKALASKGDWKDLTVDEMRATQEALENLQASARNRATAITTKGRVDREELVARLAGEGAASPLAKKAPVKNKNEMDAWDRAKKLLSSADKFMLPIPTMIDQLVAGDELGLFDKNTDRGAAWHEAFTDPMRAANSKHIALLSGVLEPLIKQFEAMPKEIRSRLSEAIDGRALFPNHPAEFLPSTRASLLMLLLNSGNEQNRQMLQEGRQIANEDLMRALNMLTHAEVQWAQGVLDSMESLKKEAFDLEERDSGLRPEAVKASPLELAGGTFRGGYFPLKYEYLTEPKPSAYGLEDPTYVRPGTARGHLKARNEFAKARIVTLDPNIIYSHLAQVTRDIAFREVIKSANQLLTAAPVRQTLIERLGEDAPRYFEQWLKDIGQVSGNPLSSNNPAVKVHIFMRSNLTANAMGFNFANAIGDLANLPTALVSTKLSATRLFSALTQFAQAPLATRELTLQKSAVLRSMEDDLVRRFQGQVRQFNQGKLSKAREALLKHAFIFKKVISTLNNTSIWLGAYQQALRDGREESAAVGFADDVVLRTEPSHSAVESSTLTRDRGWVGQSLSLFGYFNLLYARYSDALTPLSTQEFLSASLGQKVKTGTGVAIHALAIAVMSEVLGNLLMGRGPEAGDADPDDPENKVKKYAHWLERQLLFAPMRTLPLVGDGANVFEALIMHKQPNVRTSPEVGAALQLTRAIEKATSENASEADAAIAVLKGFGLVTGTPTKPLEVQGKYLFDVTTGAREVPTPFHLLGGAAYGEKDNQGANLFTEMGDALR